MRFYGQRAFAKKKKPKRSQKGAEKAKRNSSEATQAENTTDKPKWKRERKPHSKSELYARYKSKDVYANAFSEGSKGPRAVGIFRIGSISHSRGNANVDNEIKKKKWRKNGKGRRRGNGMGKGGENGGLRGENKKLLSSRMFLITAENNFWKSCVVFVDKFGLLFFLIYQTQFFFLWLTWALKKLSFCI